MRCVPRVLVADDGECNRQLLCQILLSEHYEVEEAADGEEALLKARGHPPDVILLDVLMPKLDGYGVCKELKDDPRTRLIPVIMLTGLDQFDAKLRGLEVGVDDFLTKPFNVAELKARVRSLAALKRFTDELERAEVVLESLAQSLEIRDGYTGDHGKRVGNNAAAIGRILGLEEGELRTLRLGGIFHDLGKLIVPDGVLHKPGRLTDEEVLIIRRHPAAGARICQPMRTLSDILPIIRHHHERLDGSGYPDGLRGDEISLAARIISVSDIYDALATRRPYKEPLPKDRCLAVLKEEAERGWWDRDVVRALERVA